MRGPLKPLEQRVAALTLAVMFVALVYLVCVHWWFTAPLLEMNAEFKFLEDAHQHYQGLLAQRKPLEQQLANSVSLADTEKNLLAGTDSGAGVAQLMGLLANYVQGTSTVGSGCRLANRMPIASAAEGAYLPVRVSLNLECGIEPLAKLLHQIENSHPYLFVESISARNGGPQGAGKVSNRLLIQMQVSGYLRNTAQSGATP